jgi:DNA polymerase III sliding clamp (beta) subunit (PCNA family)
MTEPTIRTVRTNTKKEAKRLKFVYTAASRDVVRPTLRSVHNDSKAQAVLASDGYRLHAVKVEQPFDSMNDLPALTMPVKSNGDGEPKQLKSLPSTASTIEMQEIEGRFPDYNVIIPTSEPQFEILLYPRYLADIASMAEGPIRFVFHGQTRPIEVFCTVSEAPAYALLMPMMTRGVDLSWKPGKHGETEGPPQEETESEGQS